MYQELDIWVRLQMFFRSTTTGKMNSFYSVVVAQSLQHTFYQPLTHCLRYTRQ